MNTQELVMIEPQEEDFRATVQTDSIVTNNTIHDFQQELNEYVISHPGTILHLDLSNVRRFSCTVLSDLLYIQQELHKTNGDLRLSGVHGNVRKIIRLTGMSEMFTLEHRHAH